MAAYTTEERGSRNSLEYRMFFKDAEGKPVSAMHDIPMLASEGVYNMVVEVPRWSNAKMEIDLKSPLNPIKQDVKKGKLRGALIDEVFKVVYQLTIIIKPLER